MGNEPTFKEGSPLCGLSTLILRILGFSAATRDRWQHNPWRLLRQVPHDVLRRSGTELARNNNVLLVKIGLGRELVNPIYHHRSLLFFNGKPSTPSFFINQPTNWNLGHLWARKTFSGESWPPTTNCGESENHLLGLRIKFLPVVV